jgi:hypothetical protein
MQLSLMRMLLHILFLIQLGNGIGAAAKLREHHQLMDSNLIENLWSSTGKFELSICNRTHKLHFQWFTQAESFVFGYLLSGIVNLPDYSGIKAWNFHVEGVRVVDSTSFTFSLILT